MRGKPDESRPPRIEPTLGVKAEQPFARQLRLQELPEEVDDEKRRDPRHRRRARALIRRMAQSVGLVVFVVGSLAVGYHFLPTLGNQASRGVQALIENAVRVRAAIDARTGQAATLGDKERRQREAARKEAAWKDFFKRSPRCAIEANQTTVECVNEYIRAKRDFDHRWDAGQL
jgi:hypothetical protein